MQKLVLFRHLEEVVAGGYVASRARKSPTLAIDYQIEPDTDSPTLTKYQLAMTVGMKFLERSSRARPDQLAKRLREQIAHEIYGEVESALRAHYIELVKFQSQYVDSLEGFDELHKLRDSLDEILAALRP